MSDTIVTTGEILGRKNGLLWLRIEWRKGTFKILTLDDKWLPHGSKTAKIVKIEYDPKSIMPRDDGQLPQFSGWTGDVKLLDVIESNQGTEEDRGPDEVGGAS